MVKIANTITILDAPVRDICGIIADFSGIIAAIVVGY